MRSGLPSRVHRDFLVPSVSLTTVGGITVSPKMPMFSSPGPVNLSSDMAQGNQGCRWSSAASRLTLREDRLDSPDGPSIITRSLEVAEEGREEAEGDMIVEGQRGAMLEECELPLLTLKMEEGAASRGRRAACRSWKR